MPKQGESTEKHAKHAITGEGLEGISSGSREEETDEYFVKDLSRGVCK